MGERIMKNFPIEYEGNVYWRSRSCTVVGYVFCYDKEGYVCVLANQRGPGAPTCRGMWNVPCGYIGFIEECGDVDGEHAVARETFEETGVQLKPEQFQFDSVSYSKDGDENINLRYWVELKGTPDDYPVSNAHNEEGETTDIRWIKLRDVDNYEWAFGQRETIHKMYDKHVSLISKPGYIVELSVINNETLKTHFTDTLCICNDIEECKKYTKEHAEQNMKLYEESGKEHGEYNETDFDATVTYKDENREWLHWYQFKPVYRYNEQDFKED